MISDQGQQKVSKTRDELEIGPDLEPVIAKRHKRFQPPEARDRFGWPDDTEEVTGSNPVAPTSAFEGPPAECAHTAKIKNDIVDPVGGKAVDRAVRELVRPLLRENGFDHFTGRSAWRKHANKTVDLVVFQSFSSYAAGVLGCTTYSFSVTAGVLYQCTRDQDVERPKSYELTFRFELGKSIRQPFFRPAGTTSPHDRPDIWYVLPDGANLTECVIDARTAIRNSGLPLIERFTEPQNAFDALLTESSTPTGFGTASVKMPGNPDAPLWRDAALAIGHLVTDDPRPEIRNAPVLEAVRCHDQMPRALGHGEG